MVSKIQENFEFRCYYLLLGVSTFTRLFRPRFGISYTFGNYFGQMSESRHEPVAWWALHAGGASISDTAA